MDQCPICNKDGVARNRLLLCDFCPKAFHYGCVGLEIRERAQKGAWLCPECRAADELTRLDDKPPRRRNVKTRGGTAQQPRTSDTEVTLPSTPLIVTAKLRRPVGRPRKVVIVEDASGTDFPTTDYEAPSERALDHEQPVTSGNHTRHPYALAQPAGVEVESGGPAASASAGPQRPPAAAIDLTGRSQVTRRAPLPMAARMLLVRDEEEPPQPPLPR